MTCVDFGGPGLVKAPSRTSEFAGGAQYESAPHRITQELSGQSWTAESDQGSEPQKSPVGSTYLGSLVASRRASWSALRYTVGRLVDSFDQDSRKPGP